MDTLAFLIRRLGQACVVMLVISLIGFSIQDNLGDPLRELVGQSVSEEERKALRDAWGSTIRSSCNTARFLGKAVQGDLGTSYFFKKPALEVIFNKFPATFELVLSATLIIILVSVPVGIYCAINPKSAVLPLCNGDLDRRHIDTGVPDCDFHDLHLRHLSGLAAVLWARR